MCLYLEAKLFSMESFSAYVINSIFYDHHVFLLQLQQLILSNRIFTSQRPVAPPTAWSFT